MKHFNIIMLDLQETSMLNPLRVMVINDMLYLIHVKGLAEHASPVERSQHQLAFVDLEKSCCKVFTFSDHTFLFLSTVCFLLLKSYFFAAAYKHRSQWHCAGACIYPGSIFSQIPCWSSCRCACHSTWNSKANVRTSRENYWCRVHWQSRWQQDITGGWSEFLPRDRPNYLALSEWVISGLCVIKIEPWNL